MIPRISESVASRGLMVLFSLIIVFHLLVLLQVIPFQMVWGGRLNNVGEMYAFEAVSIALNVLMLAVVLVRAGVISLGVNQHAMQILLWMMAALFILNTVGNLFSTNAMEKMIFTPITLVLSIFCIRLALVSRLK